MYTIEDYLIGGVLGGIILFLYLQFTMYLGWLIGHSNQPDDSHEQGDN